MKHGTVIQMAVQQMTCTGCGAEANASCNCGKPYVPKKQRAIDALKENPNRSDRAIAADLGVHHSTVNEARKESGVGDPTGERQGRDGKVYRLPQREPDIESEIEPDNRHDAFLLRADQARQLAVYSGPIDDEIYEAAQLAAASWQALVASIQHKRGEKS